MEEMDKTEFQLGSTTKEYGNAAIEPGPLVIDDEIFEANCESDDSFIIKLDEEEHNEYLLETCASNVSADTAHAADGDDDEFFIIYEKPAPEVQIIANCCSSANSRSVKSQAERNKNKHLPNQQSISIPLANNTQEYEENNTLQESYSNADSLDDSVCIIDEVYPVNNGVNHKALLDSSVKKKLKIECRICFDGPDEISANQRNLVSTVCGHIFCNECLKMALKDKKQCPQCRKKLTAKQYHPIYI